MASYRPPPDDAATSTETPPLLAELRKQFHSLPDDALQVVPRQVQNDKSDKSHVVPINTIVLQYSFHSDATTNGTTEWKPILAIVSERDLVDLDKVKYLLHQQHTPTNSDNVDAVIPMVLLAPSEKVGALVGYPPGCVPPLGHIIPNERCSAIPTWLDQRLIQDTARRRLLGGGGHPDYQSSVRLTALVGMDHVQIADISVDVGQDDEEELQSTKPQRTISLPPWGSQSRPKPFFPVETPPLDAGAIEDSSSLPVTQWVTVVGPIASVRRMSKRLVFCDLVPLGYEAADDHVNGVGVSEGKLHPLAIRTERKLLPEWRSATDNKDMAVQLIAGKTMLQALGEVRGQAALKKLHPGMIVMAQAKVNFYNSQDSMQRWVSQRSLDLAMLSYEVLEYEADLKTNNNSPKGFAAKGGVMPTDPNSKATKPFLQLKQLFSDDGDDDDPMQYVQVVDSVEGVQNFSKDLEHLLSSLPEIYNTNDGVGDNESSQGSSNLDFATGVNGVNGNSQSEGHDDEGDGSFSSFVLVGLDAEWKPLFYLDRNFEAQPVAVLQISIQYQPMDWKRIFLLDLQTLLRPLLSASEPMTETERAVNDAVSTLFLSTRLIKVGFQLLNDLQKLAGSFPHLPAFQEIHGVLETTLMAKKIMHSKGMKHVRTATSSLNRMSETFLDASVNKEQQVSDWSQRPLTREQIEYASLDAAITPALMRQFLQTLEVKMFQKPELGRWKGDVSFQKMLASWKFLFLKPDVDPKLIKKLKATKPHRGDHPYIASQMWVTGEPTPDLPSVPAHEDGPYTDVFGILRLPSTGVRICTDGTLDSAQRFKFLDSLVGQKTGKSKEHCLTAMLAKAAEDKNNFPDGARLEYPPRSGFVEFEDAVALFVNMPEKASNEGQPRSYPNEWLDDGKVLTWFVRNNEWHAGTTRLAKKLMDTDTAVTLFVRVIGKNYFLCCGRCHVEEPRTTTSIVSKEKQDSWHLTQLNLKIRDWEKLSSTDTFLNLVV